MINDIVEQHINQAMATMFPHGAGTTNHHRVKHFLDQVARCAFREGRNQALLGLMTANDVAEHYQITPRRARALIENRHKRFGTGMKLGNSWLICRDELPNLAPTHHHA